MFVRTLESLQADGKVKILGGGKARAARYVTADDGMGFSLSDNIIGAGMEFTLWYKHHWEANYVVSGAGTVTEIATGKVWDFAPGMLYTVGPNDRHVIAASEDLRIVSIFSPPLAGDETHDPDGAYPPTGPVPETETTLFVRTLDGLREEGREMTVAGGSARTLRMLLRGDETGFSLSDVRLAAGNQNVLWYKHHWETNHILSGSGTVTDLGTGESWPLAPGTAYNVGPEDRHSMHAHTDLHLLSVFCPALAGDEQHDAEGTIPASGPTPPGPRRS